MSRLRTMARASVLAALVAGTSAARADDASDLQGLLNETVVTTASKSAETGAAAPATATTLTAEDIRRYGIRTLDEALDYLSLGMWTSSSRLTTDVGARGVVLPSDVGSHLLLLIDGHVVNEPLFGTARFDRGAGIPIEMVDHIEVILGPGSVLYGTDAMEGVINVITKRAKDFGGAHVVGETEVGNSWRAAAGAGYRLPFLSPSSELTLMLDYYSQAGPSLDFPVVKTGFDQSHQALFQYQPEGPRNGLWGGRATQANTAQAPSGILRFASGPFEVETQAKIFKRSAPYDNTDFDQNANFDDPGQYQVDRQAWIDVKHHATLSTILQTTTRVYGDSYDYQRYADTSWGAACLPYGVNECRQRAIGVSRWGGVELQASLDWLKDTSLVTLLGADGRVRYAASKNDLLDYDGDKPLRSSVGAFNRTDETLGAYAQQTWRPVPWLGLNGGARLDLDPRFPAQVSPRVAGTVRPWQGGTIKLIYSDAFRAPTIGESFYSDPDQLLSVGLKPETMQSAEASLEQRMGAHKLVFGVFRSHWENLIELYRLSPAELMAAQMKGEINITETNYVSQYRNVSSIETLGFNGGIEGTNTGGALRYALNVTGARATLDNGLEPSHPLGAAPNIFGNARVSYDLPGLWPVVAVAARWLAARPADQAFDANYVPLPYAPADLEVRGTVSGEAPKVPGLSYRASVSWASSSIAPYVVGPALNLDPSCLGPTCARRTDLLPVDTFRVMLGLQYDLDP